MLASIESDSLQWISKMAQTEFIEYTHWEKSKKRELLQISSERSTDLSLKEKMNLLWTEFDDIKIIY